MPGTLLLGAHCDDLAFSLGGALYDGYFGRVQPITVYTVSNYSRRHPPMEIAMIGKRRCQEDRRFFCRIPTAAPPLWLGRPDAPLRLGIEPADTRSIKIPLHEEAGFLAAELAHCPFSFERVVAPLALGGHIDHLQVRAAAMHLRENRELLFYEDLPYAGEISPEEILTAVKALAEELGGELTPLFLPSPAILPARQWAIRCYSSQIGPESLEQLMAHPRRIGEKDIPAERIWGRRK